jgi:hypothetical protein
MRRRIFWPALLLLWLSAVAWAWADLGALLAWQRRGDSGAFVSSGFHDWRGVSKYRSRPGLHAGYDIAMLPGSAVRTPWAGTVVSIAPWYGYEVGVTLRLDSGWEATFGHITSSVHVGQQVRAGDTVGRVVVDHVDVKVRDHRGGYVDFAVHKIRSTGEGIAALTQPLLPALPPRYSEKEKKAAAQAFAEYNRLLASLAEDEAQVRSGLLARKALPQRHKRLDALRPLAVLHAELTSQVLPRKPVSPTFEADPGRPVTDALLGRSSAHGEIQASSSPEVTP